MYNNEKNKLKQLIPDFLYDLVEDHQNLHIAGGAITSVFTNSDIHDLDIYFTSKIGYTEILTSVLLNSTIVSVTNKSILVNHSGQLLNFILFDIFEKPSDIFNAFDYTIVMGAYDIQNDEFILHKDFMIDNMKRQLKFNQCTKYPILSLLRVDKYKKRGYTISRNDLVRIALTVSELNINSYEEIEDQIGGMYGVDIKKIIDTTKPFKLADTIDELSDLSESYETFNLITWTNKEDLINRFIETFNLKHTLHIVKIKNKFFIQTTSKHLMEIKKGKIPSEYLDKIVELKDDVEIYLYKYVKNVDNNLFSFDDKTFEYKIGEQVNSLTHNMYAGVYDNISSFPYKGVVGANLIKLKIKVGDITNINHKNIEFKTAFVEKIMTNKLEYNSNSALEFLITDYDDIKPNNVFELPF